MALELIILAIIVAVLVIFLFASKPWKWPFVKLMPTIYLKPHEIYGKTTQLLRESKGTIIFRTAWFTNLDILITADPANVQHVLNSKFSNYDRGSAFRNAFDFLGKAVFIKDLNSWKEDKKFTYGFYKEHEFHKSTPRIIHHTINKGLIPVLDHASRGNEVIDFQDMFNRYMLDATFLLATGSDLASLRPGFPNTPLLNGMDDITEAVFYRQILPERVWKLKRWFGIGTENKLAKACDTFNQILEEFVANKREMAERNQENKENFDVLKFYMAELDNNRKSTKSSTNLADKAFLAANIMTLLFAGRDTSGAILTWFFYLLSTNPKAKKKILHEISEHSPSQKHTFSDVENLGKLVYLHSALSESLRLYPTAPILIRDTIQEDVLPSGHKVDKKTKMILCSYSMGRMEDIWGEDCEEFKPERWLTDKGGMRQVTSNSFLSFGSGPWACPGREMAFARLKGVVATILHNYDVEVVEGQDARISLSALLTMKNGFKVRVSSRYDE